ncbi:snare complex subunit [Grosmannia clavigera kw1407]|uniref:Snare complex subunit n=1 Tax=Grosmannia clavigera (strain kw1407 / UAMH 11150) TaxID=655863 RepID=F0XLS5_GROCL|nr:snare complex subunit [Grosmannia clavigera kw1407]EFX01530.1 snare complex subunit [Grosmannia clavigera kw1407]
MFCCTVYLHTTPGGPVNASCPLPFVCVSESATRLRYLDNPSTSTTNQACDDAQHAIHDASNTALLCRPLRLHPCASHSIGHLPVKRDSPWRRKRQRTRRLQARDAFEARPPCAPAVLVPSARTRQAAGGSCDLGVASAMWRDRTNLYISYRQSYAHHPKKRTRYYGGLTGDSVGAAASSALDEDRRGLLSGPDPFYDHADETINAAGDAVIEMDLLPPRWADISDEVTEILGDVARQSQQLDRLHQKHVLPGFNEDEAAKRAEEGEIERLTQAITRGFHDCHRCIQRIDQMVRESKGQGSLSRADETMAKNVQISLATRIQEASATFRKKQSTYLRKLKGVSGGPALAMAGISSNYAADPSLLESDADRSFSQLALQEASSSQPQQRQQQIQKMQRQSNDAVIAQREREIGDIAQGIIDLADLFRDLQTMVIDQGTMLDRIDYNVERMNTDVKAADRELVVASGYQRKTTKRKIMLLLLLIIVGLFILLLIKPKRHRGGGGDGGGSEAAKQVPGNVDSGGEEAEQDSPFLMSFLS